MKVAVTFAASFIASIGLASLAAGFADPSVDAVARHMWLTPVKK